MGKVFLKFDMYYTNCIIIIIIYYKNIILDIKTTVGDGFQFLLVPTESTATPPSDEFDDLLNDSISHTFLDSLIYVMFPVIKIYTVSTHNRDIFVRPKKVSLFWEISLFRFYI